MEVENQLNSGDTPRELKEKKEKRKDEKAGEG